MNKQTNTTMFSRWQQIILSLLLLSASLLNAAESVTAIYQPTHKPATELVDAVNKIYGDEAKLLAEGGKLIIRGETATVDQIQEILVQLDQASRRFIVEISNQPKSNGSHSTTYSTSAHTTGSRGITQQQFTVAENSPFIIMKEQQQQQLNSVRPLWQPIKTIPAQQEYLSLNIRSAQRYVYVDFKWQTLENGVLNLKQQQIDGPIDQWLTISGNSAQTNRQVKTYGSHRNELYIKVSPLDE